MNIGIIGLGRLGASLARGLDKTGDYKNIYVYNRTAEKTNDLSQQTKNLKPCKSGEEILNLCDIIFLWTKPADAEEVLEKNKDIIKEKKPILISCMINIPFEKYTDRYIESLPNVNMAAGKGVTLLSRRSKISDKDFTIVSDILKKVGSVYEVPPKDMVLYGALTSCGPALYVTMTEILADVLSSHHNFDRDICRKMTLETVSGTMALQEHDNIDAKEVVYRVAHPGGSSEPGVNYLHSILPASYEEMLKNMRKW